MYDSAASIAIGAMLGSVALSLVRLNQRYLLGQSVGPGALLAACRQRANRLTLVDCAEIEDDIRRLLLSRPAIDDVYRVQTQWMGPAAFSFKVGSHAASGSARAPRPCSAP